MSVPFHVFSSYAIILKAFTFKLHKYPIYSGFCHGTSEPFIWRSLKVERHYVNPNIRA